MLPRLFIFALLLAGCAAPISIERNPDRALLEPIATRAFESVGDFTNSDLSNLQWQLARPERIRDELMALMRPFWLKHIGDQQAAHSYLTRSSALQSQALWGFYSPQSGIFINKQLALEIGKTSPGHAQSVYLALFIHEAAHAAADRLFSASETLLSLRPEQHTAFNALSEGYAQYITSQICLKNGCYSAYWNMTRKITQVTEEDKDEIDSSHGNSTLWSDNQLSYVDGENFVRYAVENHGDKVLDKLFYSPPDNPWHIVYPERYFDVDTYRGTLDLERGMRYLAGRFPAGEWLKIRTSTEPREIQNLLAPVADSREQAESFTQHHLQSVVLAVEKPNDLDRYSGLLGLAEIDTDDNAALTLRRIEDSLKKRMESISESMDENGKLLKLSVEYIFEPLNATTDNGFSLSAKFTAAGKPFFEIDSLYLRSGRVLGWASTTNSGIEKDTLRRALSGAFKTVGTADDDSSH